MTTLPTRAFRAVPAAELVEALARAAADPAVLERAVPRTPVPVDAGELLLMPAEDARYVGVKVVSIAPGNVRRGLPRIHGSYLLFRAETLEPIAVLDAQELTAVRTAAVSMVGVQLLQAERAARTVVVGTGVQARSHLRLLQELGWGGELRVLGRRPEAVQELGVAATPNDLRSAELVVCCTSASRPVISRADLGPAPAIVAVGSHLPDVSELAVDVLEGAEVVVEDIPTALCEAGEVVQAIRAGVLAESTVRSMGEVLRGAGRIDTSRIRLFKSVGMAWQDLVVAGLVSESAARGEP